jgi:acetyl-CoA carboxylase biotin carboxyl carrier protein
MTGVHDDEAKPVTGDALTPIVDTVRLTALDLIASLPERPSRLRVRAAGVSVDLDWRVTAPTPVPPPPPLVVDSADRQAPNATVDGRPHATGSVNGSVHSTANGTLNGAGNGGQRSSWHVVHAPAIGTFYHAPEPGKPPFVRPGAVVEAGQQVGIIEAMKLMLPVEADRTGRVVDVLVPDGQPVQYGEPLIELGPVDSA